MSYALIKNQKVINIIHASPEFIQELLLTQDTADDAILIDDTLNCPNPGDGYIDGAFISLTSEPIILNQKYKCMFCEFTTETDEEVRTHIQENIDHVFIKIFY